MATVATRTAPVNGKEVRDQLLEEFARRGEMPAPGDLMVQGFWVLVARQSRPRRLLIRSLLPVYALRYALNDSFAPWEHLRHYRPRHGGTLPRDERLGLRWLGRHRQRTGAKPSPRSR